MTTTIVKAKKKTVEAEAIDVLSSDIRAALVDELGALKVKLDKMRPVTQRVMEIEKTLRGYADEVLAADVGTLVIGSKYEVSIGKKSMVRRVTDKKKALNLLGQEVALEKMTLPLKALDDYLTPEERAEGSGEGTLEGSEAGPRKLEKDPSSSTEHSPMP